MQGLTKQEVREREQAGKVNVKVSSSTRTIKQIIKDNVFTYFNLIFTVLAILLILAGSIKDLTFMLIVFANATIGILQEIRSKRTLDSLKILKMPKAHVLREGKRTEVPTEKLVLDDIVILRSGNQIPADAKVVEGSIQVNESLLTGEADEIGKSVGDKLLSGSYVVSGECMAVLTAVGVDSYISKLTKEATKDKQEESEMIKSLNRLVKVVGIIIIPMGLTLIFQDWYILNGSFKSSIISMVAAILGMIPEGLYMTASIAMVVSALRLAKKDVLVQNMKCIEALARVDVLCVDKTGTITETDMKVEGFVKISDSISEEELEVLIGDIVRHQSKDNATMAALQDFFTKPGGREVTSTCGFSSKYKYSSTCFVDGCFVIGAPEFVLRAEFSRYSEYINKMSNQGYRVLAVAQTSEVPNGGDLQMPARLLGLIFLDNPVRSSAKETFEYFAENGVEIKVISGDNPETVSHVAIEAGIPNGDHYVDAGDLSDEQSIYEAVERFTVFGRVTPEQKLSFVRALRKQGKTVGMTGDGVNDVLALRDADCSVAMASGSEAASNAAMLVLMDSDFSKMPSVVSEGRRVVNNIQKAASLYLTKNIFSLLLAIFSVINVLKYPLKPSQITLISMFTIGVPSFILSLEPNFERIKGRFLSNVLKMALPAGITMFISVSSLVVFGQVFNISNECISTSSTMLVALVGFLYLAKVATPFNRLHIGMMAILIAGMAYSVLFMPRLFGINSITTEAAMLLVVFLIATEGLFRYVHKGVGFGAWLSRRREMKRLAKRKNSKRKHRR